MELKTAKEIIVEVCDEHIPGHYQVTEPDDNKDKKVKILRLQSKNKEVSFTWDILNPGLTERLLWCDAHSFCAYVLRHVPMDESRWTRIKNKFRKQYK